jgi:hypothetical protein
MSIREILRLVFFEEDELIIPICDEEKSCPLPVEINEDLGEEDPDHCILSNGESKNIFKMKQILKGKGLDGSPEGPAPDFELNRSMI